MSTTVEHIIPIQGLSIGVHEFDFKLDQQFFAQFDDSLVNGDFDVHLVLDKQSTLMDFEFTFEGVEKTACDRCLAGISLPINNEARMVVKFDENERTEGDIVFIHPGSPVFDVATFMYEAIALALPIVKKYDCENDNPRPCNMEVLKHLIDDEPVEEPKNDIWSELKKLKPNKG